MNRGLLLKAFRETWLTTVLLGLAILVVEGVLIYSLAIFRDEISSAWRQIPFVRHMLKGLLGAELADRFKPDILVSFAWIHPVILALLWAHAIAFCTRVPAGEVDRGTIDILLGLPVSRWQLYLSDTLAWLVSGSVVVLMVLAGNLLGVALLKKGLPMQSRAVPMLIVNLFGLYVMVGSLTWLMSSLSNRRGRAIAVVLAMVLCSFLLNYLAEFWHPAQSISFLSVLHYYQPAIILAKLVWPASDLLTLLVLAGMFWIAGGIVFIRRDLATT